MKDFNDAYNTSTPKASKGAVKLVGEMKHLIHLFDDEEMQPLAMDRNGPSDKTTEDMRGSVKEVLAYIAALEEVVLDMSNLSCGLTTMQPKEVTKLHHLQTKARRILTAP